jgi:hypothetical protein
MVPKAEINCQACGAPIIWRKTKNGDYVPLDAEPVISPDGELLYVSHFATCPKAEQWRKKAKSRAIPAE